MIDKTGPRPRLHFSGLHLYAKKALLRPFFLRLFPLDAV